MLLSVVEYYVGLAKFAKDILLISWNWLIFAP